MQQKYAKNATQSASRGQQKQHYTHSHTQRTRPKKRRNQNANIKLQLLPFPSCDSFPKKNLKFSLWTCDGATTRVNGLGSSGSSSSAPHIALATYRNACKLRNRHVASGAEFMNLPPTAGMSAHSHSLFFSPKMFVLVRFLRYVRCWTVELIYSVSSYVTAYVKRNVRKLHLSLLTMILNELSSKIYKYCFHSKYLFAQHAMHYQLAKIFNLLFYIYFLVIITFDNICYRTICNH